MGFPLYFCLCYWCTALFQWVDYHQEHDYKVQTTPLGPLLSKEKVSAITILQILLRLEGYRQ